MRLLAIHYDDDITTRTHDVPARWRPQSLEGRSWLELPGRAGDHDVRVVNLAHVVELVVYDEPTSEPQGKPVPVLRTPDGIPDGWWITSDLHGTLGLERRR